MALLPLFAFFIDLVRPLFSFYLWVCLLRRISGSANSAFPLDSSSAAEQVLDEAGKFEILRCDTIQEAVLQWERLCTLYHGTTCDLGKCAHLDATAAQIQLQAHEHDDSADEGDVIRVVELVTSDNPLGDHMPPVPEVYPADVAAVRHLGVNWAPSVSSVKAEGTAHEVKVEGRAIKLEAVSATAPCLGSVKIPCPRARATPKRALLTPSPPSISVPLYLDDTPPRPSTLRAASSTKSMAAPRSRATPKHSRAAPKHSRATPKRAHATPKRVLTTPSPPVPLYLDDTPPPHAALICTVNPVTNCVSTHDRRCVVLAASATLGEDGWAYPTSFNLSLAASLNPTEPLFRAATPSSSLSAAHSSSTGAESVVKDEETEDTGHFFYNESTRQIFRDAKTAMSCLQRTEVLVVLSSSSELEEALKAGAVYDQKGKARTKARGKAKTKEVAEDVEML
ncbi:hypothetical protein K438DRAFT_1952748 [Mycena galopus ATCC 62051]|nr:hypothetical protein K438DRAFT_1952748 [Mycena galopus ATCC 62051]